MKRIISALIICTMSLICLTGCGKTYDEKFIGKWEAFEMVIDGTTYEDYYGVPLNAMVQFDIQDKGKGEWHSPMSEIDGSSSGMLIDWEQKNDTTIAIKAYIKNDKDSEQNFSMSYGGETLSYFNDGVEFRMKRVDSFAVYTKEELTQMFSSLIYSMQ